MQETRFNNGRNSFAYVERLDTAHTILLTKNVTASHYVINDLNEFTTVTIPSELLHIEHTDKGTVLHLACGNSGEFTLILSNVVPEQLCDAVEAARLQEVDA